MYMLTTPPSSVGVEHQIEFIFYLLYWLLLVDQSSSATTANDPVIGLGGITRGEAQTLVSLLFFFYF